MTIKMIVVAPHLSGPKECITKAAQKVEREIVEDAPVLMRKIKGRGRLKAAASQRLRQDFFPQANLRRHK